MKRLLVSVGLLLGAAAATAQDLDYAGFLGSLRAEKTSIKREGDVDQPFFAVKGKAVGLYGDHVQVFEYPDRAKAEKDAVRVSADGMTIGTAKPHWLAPPHFFRRGKLIVLYVGSDAQVLKALQERLGPAFAGG
jgi:hypothetical protein